MRKEKRTPGDPLLSLPLLLLLLGSLATSK
jgi:hypothetical protein